MDAIAFLTLFLGLTMGQQSIRMSATDTVFGSLPALRRIGGVIIADAVKTSSGRTVGS